MSTARTSARQLGVAVRAAVVLTLALGIVYPLAVTGIGQAVANNQANGSPVAVDGATVGSELIGQSFTDEEGAALPQWFQSRPSAAGDGYDGGASSGSNLGPTNPDLAAAIDERREAVAALEGVNPKEVPADALTASSSGLDPHISPEYALLQANRVAAERGLDTDEVRALVEDAVEGRQAGALGESRVNVLQLNIALAQLDT
ncbi:potassium-transporting ATPase subunit KdpC [Arthrobacter sp. zg-Y820]|uniref:potassium-transporting ATPase subunit KdpC n=1 Tax=unclassified Arthrobacter TaxID=235627 RepID=UPI001E56A035|nr:MULTISPECIES: potassium-transporting ATPase subunit KdpC [unclassified Arthrobacter]MCC9196768.1 potassium-transporting ATPase subunit KdpC [Arthrobacter sp. zg-Y820]MDK1279630.1 potassium-transporting ATPase subunit KdpC [Arthrobacter sp. zg.Y820]WIB07999.1 potassium-transporting ATPase subunit KdpC [Arthrobacter sp. zg-Y820]